MDVEVLVENYTMLDPRVTSVDKRQEGKIGWVSVNPDFKEERRIGRPQKELQSV